MSGTGMHPYNADRSILRDAASVVVVRRDCDQPEVLMGMRGPEAAFMPSKYVFPGGAVDHEDNTTIIGNNVDALTLARLEAEPRHDSVVTPRQLLAAALRELSEETGLLIGHPGQSEMTGYAKAGLLPDPSVLHYFFRAITPPARPRRFDARFFMVDAVHIQGDTETFSSSCGELSHLHWVPVTEAGDLQLPFITEVVLAECIALVHAAGNGVLTTPLSVPFFDNRGARSRFVQIGVK